MPQPFEKCIADGGRVRSKQVDKDTYVPICYLNGKSYAGEPKKYKRLSSRKGKK